MHIRTLLVLLVSFTLFSYQCKKSNIERFKIKKKTELPLFLETKVQEKLKKGQQGALENSLNLGVRKGLSHSTYLNFKNLNLLHLFTPSGLHYFPIFWLLKFIFSYKVLRGYSIIFWLLCLQLEGFYSLKRIAAIKMLWLWNKKSPYQLQLFHIFLFVFLVDFIIGSFQFSPLSWGYSFLFLGLIFSNDKEPLITRIALGQVFISFFENFCFNPISFLSGYIISLLASLSFPMLFIGYWNPFGEIPLNDFFLSSLDWIVKQASQISYFSRPLNPLICLISYWAIINKRKITTGLLFLFL